MSYLTIEIALRSISRFGSPNTTDPGTLAELTGNGRDWQALAQYQSNLGYWTLTRRGEILLAGLGEVLSV